MVIIRPQGSAHTSLKKFGRFETATPVSSIAVNQNVNKPVSQRSWVQIPYESEFFFFFQVLFSTTSSVVFLAARISQIRFFTAVQIYEFHITKIIVNRLFTAVNGSLRILSVCPIHAHMFSFENVYLLHVFAYRFTY